MVPADPVALSRVLAADRVARGSVVYQDTMTCIASIESTAAQPNIIVLYSNVRCRIQVDAVVSISTNIIQLISPNTTDRSITVQHIDTVSVIAANTIAEDLGIAGTVDINSIAAIIADRIARADLVIGRDMHHNTMVPISQIVDAKGIADEVAVDQVIVGMVDIKPIIAVTTDGIKSDGVLIPPIYRDAILIGQRLRHVPG